MTPMQAAKEAKRMRPILAEIRTQEMRMKEMFVQAHEELIEEYLEKHPNATEAEAYNATADAAYGRMQDKYADMADMVRMKMKEQGTW